MGAAPSPGGAALDDVSAVKTLETIVAYTTRVIASGTKAAGRNAVAIADVVRALGLEELSMSTENYDVLILGGGNAGMGVTVATRAAGLSVAMVEARDLGGTCPNRGCTPKKCWWRPVTRCTRSSGRASMAFPSASRGSTGPPSSTGKSR